MPTPCSYQDWIDVAMERAKDANAMLSERDNSNGPVYMVGFAVECTLNGYLAKRGISRPRREEGEPLHDLLRLWRATDLRLKDISDSTGHKTWLIEKWGTHLRYDTERNFSSTNAEIIQAARQIIKYLKVRIHRHRRGRRS